MGNMNTQAILDVRQAMANNGFTRLIPVIGKVPPLDEWQMVDEVSREMLEEWERDWPNADNTGILTKLVPTFDIDILDAAAADAAEAMVRERYGDRGVIMVRVGLAPKRAFRFVQVSRSRNGSWFSRR
jgi:hypothetical protein